MAYTAADPQHPAEALSPPSTDRASGKLSAFNDRWLKDVDLSRRPAHPLPQQGRHRGGRLGHAAERPARSPYPLILSIHGGPHGAYGSDFDFEFQWLAANGYAVLYTNPRGSTGYGEKFLWATWGGWGKLDYRGRDGRRGLRAGALPDRPKRLGVTGYSYGGFLTNWIITQTDSLLRRP